MTRRAKKKTATTSWLSSPSKLRGMIRRMRIGRQPTLTPRMTENNQKIDTETRYGSYAKT